MDYYEEKLKYVKDLNYLITEAYQVSKQVDYDRILNKDQVDYLLVLYETIADTMEATNPVVFILDDSLEYDGPENKDVIDLIAESSKYSQHTNIDKIAEYLQENGFVHYNRTFKTLILEIIRRLKKLKEWHNS